MSVEGGGPLGGQLGARGPRYPLRPPRPRAPPAPAPATAPAAPPRPSPWAEAYDKLTSYHSFDHNFEDNLSKMKVDYRTLLDRLSGDAPNPNTWGTVKIIDFAHAFFNDDDDVEPAVDDNFREGIDNFVAIFESFLAETEERRQGGAGPSFWKVSGNSGSVVTAPRRHIYEGGIYGSQFCVCPVGTATAARQWPQFTMRKFSKLISIY
ncbi:unnamed protein product [Diatraea saccharalis]|uniref:Uncharacterized protein n=1 Tax=Diatraea saccharalis TaxID=40085 RepID=A0A9N9R2Z7_9NEOP|nr:unnamed protein product [Diatraea saccharalis]